MEGGAFGPHQFLMGYVEKLASTKKLLAAGATGATAALAGSAAYKSHRNKIETEGKRKGYNQRIREELMARGQKAQKITAALRGQNEYLRLQLARRLGQVQGKQK